MRRAATVLVVALAAAGLVPSGPSTAGEMTDDVYRSHFLARDRDDRVYVVDAVVEDRPAGGLLVLEIRRRCRSCEAEVYAKTLAPGEVAVNYLSLGLECQCIRANVEAKFGGETLSLSWAWDPEQGQPSPGGTVEWPAVTANNLMNVSCFGSGSLVSAPSPFSGDPPETPRGAREFPKRLPRGFRVDPSGAPGCHVETP